MGTVPSAILGMMLVVMSVSGIGEDNSQFLERSDEFTDEVEFTLSIASQGFLQSNGVEGSVSEVAR